MHVVRDGEAIEVGVGGLAAKRWDRSGQLGRRGESGAEGEHQAAPDWLDSVSRRSSQIDVQLDAAVTGQIVDAARVAGWPATQRHEPAHLMVHAHPPARSIALVDDRA